MATQVDDGPEPEPLVLWEPPEGEEGAPVVVDRVLTRWLRPHQREGVTFLYECVMGLREANRFGAVLADDMGLGCVLHGGFTHDPSELLHNCPPRHGELLKFERHHQDVLFDGLSFQD